jgi:hypothetical protein
MAGKHGFAAGLARVWRNRVIALAILAVVLVLFVLCLCMGAVSREADEMAIRMFQKNAGESPTWVSRTDGDEAEPRTIVLGRSPGYRPSYSHGGERVGGRIMTVREPRPSNPGLN